MRKIEQLFRQDCDTLRLLIQEFEHTGAEYFRDNMVSINAMQARDYDEYIPPTVIPNIFAFLTSSSVIHAISLLEYWVPIVVTHGFKERGIELQEPFATFQKGNVLNWIKKVFKETPGLTIDFSDGLYLQLTAWMRLRNDDVHHGGYRNDRTSDAHLKSLRGVKVSDYTNLYDLQFAGCRYAVNDVELFLLRIDEAFQLYKNA